MKVAVQQCAVPVASAWRKSRARVTGTAASRWPKRTRGQGITTARAKQSSRGSVQYGDKVEESENVGSVSRLGGALAGLAIAGNLCHADAAMALNLGADFRRAASDEVSFLRNEASKDLRMVEEEVERDARRVEKVVEKDVRLVEQEVEKDARRAAAAIIAEEEEIKERVITWEMFLEKEPPIAVFFAGILLINSTVGLTWALFVRETEAGPGGEFGKGVVALRKEVVKGILKFFGSILGSYTTVSSKRGGSR